MLKLIKLANVNDSEKVFNSIFFYRNSDNSIQYVDKGFHILMKDNYLIFRDYIFSNKYIALVDDKRDNNIIVENKSKTNIDVNTLDIRYLDCNEQFLKESLMFLEKVFSNKNIRKIKMTCFKEDIECIDDLINGGYFKKELSYCIGLKNMIYLTHIFEQR